MADSEPQESDKKKSESQDENTLELVEEPIRFSAEEEEALLNESNEQKLHANSLFGKAHYSEAIQEYDKALASCPNYLDYEVAVLKSNISACNIKLQEWKAAVEAATVSLETLDRLKKPCVSVKDEQGEQTIEETEKEDQDGDEDTSEEKQTRPAQPAPRPISPASPSTPRRTESEIDRLRGKVLQRRAKSNTELGGWSNLESAEQDYKTLLLLPESALNERDKVEIRRQQRRLGPLVQAARERETAEMMGKLKDLGNGFLKPFGLSTENFNFIKDQKTGGYSMSFNQGQGGSGQ